MVKIIPVKLNALRQAIDILNLRCLRQAYQIAAWCPLGAVVSWLFRFQQLSEAFIFIVKIILENYNYYKKND